MGLNILTEKEEVHLPTCLFTKGASKNLLHSFFMGYSLSNYYVESTVAKNASSKHSILS